MRGILLMAAAVLLCPIHGSPQISGRVRDSDGNPITLALVELLGHKGRLGSVRTDARGDFDLAPSAAATGVRASQFGFEEEILDLSDLSKPLHFVLAQKPFELAEIRVEVAEASCPSDDIPAARAAWHRVLSNTRDLSHDTYWAAFLFEWRRSTGVGADFGPFQETTYDWASLGGHPESALRLWIQGSSEDLVLARRRTSGDLGFGPGFVWKIPSLEGAGIPLLFSSELAKQSTIAWGGDQEGIVLCYEDANGVRIRLASGHDEAGNLTDLLWKLETPQPVERAGGHLGFLPPEAGPALPLPRTAYFWHREEMGRNSQDYRVFSPWIIGDSDEVNSALRKLQSSIRGGTLNPGD